MSPLRTRMIEDMQLAGLSATTQEVYLQAVTALVKDYRNRSPDQLTEEEVRCYLLAVRQRNARGTFKTCHYGIQFFYRNTLGKDWALFKKRSDSPSRSACRRRFPMPRSDAFWVASAMPKPVHESLRQMWSAQDHRDRRWLFPNRRRTGPVATHVLVRTFADAVKAADLPGERRATPHTLRHAYATPARCVPCCPCRRPATGRWSCRWR